MFVERLTLFAFCVDPHTELCRRCFHKLTKGEVVWGVCKISCQTTADLKKQMAQGRNDRLTVGAQGDGQRPQGVIMRGEASKVIGFDI